jgi:hypothetical protein
MLSVSDIPLDEMLEAVRILDAKAVPQHERSQFEPETGEIYLLADPCTPGGRKRLELMGYSEVRKGVWAPA